MPTPRIEQDIQRNKALTVMAAVVFVVSSLPYLLPTFTAVSVATYASVWSDLPLVTVALIIVLWRRPAATDSRERVFWRAIGAGLACWFVGRVGWGLFCEAGLPADLPADFLFMLFYVGMLIALEADPGGPAPRPEERQRRRLAIVGGIVLLLAAYVYFALIPALVSPAGYESWKPSMVATFVLDLYVAIQLVRRLRSAADDHWRRTFRWLTVAFLYWVVIDAVDVVWLYVPISALDSGSPLDLVWSLPYAIFWGGLLVGRQPRAAPREEPAGPVLATPGSGTPLVAYAFSLPLFHALLGFLGMSDPALDPAREALLVVESLLLAGLILRTHGLIVAENRKLHQGYEDLSRVLSDANLDLEQRVRQRTAELETANERLAVDLAERTRITRQLRTAEERNLALIRAVPDTLVLIDREGVVREVHPGQTCGDVFGLAEHVGLPLAPLLPADVAAAVVAALQEDAGEDFRHLAIPLDDPRSGRRLELRVGRCGADEHLLLVQDVTVRHRIENALNQSQRLESLGVLAGGIAHDFNNLLTIILGNAQIARAMVAGSPESGSPLAAIESSARRAAKLTGSLLAYAGDAHVEIATIDLVGLVAEMESLLTTVAGSRVAANIARDDGPLWVNGNEAQLTQVLLNLFQNAVEAIEGSEGDVRLEMHRCVVDGTDLPDSVPGTAVVPGEYVRILVRDNGRGMTPAVRARVFDPFYSSKGPGRGLGLAAVLGIIRKHDGALTLSSVPDRGTTFGIYLPTCAAPAGAATHAAAGPDVQLGGVVLVADDEPDVRQILVRTLQRLGLEVLTASNGAEVLAAADEQGDHLDLVLLDYQMPRLNGAETLRRLRAGRPGLPVIMMSGFGEQSALDGVTGDRHTAFLQKPFDLGTLTALVAERFPHQDRSPAPGS